MLAYLNYLADDTLCLKNETRLACYNFDVRFW